MYVRKTISLGQHTHTLSQEESSNFICSISDHYQCLDILVVWRWIWFLEFLDRWEHHERDTRRVHREFVLLSRVGGINRDCYCDDNDRIISLHVLDSTKSTIKCSDQLPVEVRLYFRFSLSTKFFVDFSFFEIIFWSLIFYIHIFIFDHFRQQFQIRILRIATRCSITQKVQIIFSIILRSSMFRCYEKKKIHQCEFEAFLPISRISSVNAKACSTFPC